MALGAAWWRSLEASESAQAFDRFTCFYSHCDNIVFPASNATLAGADNRHVTGAAHVQLLDQPEGTIKSRIRNGMRRMRDVLVEAGIHGVDA